MGQRRDWEPILEHAAEIVDAYDSAVTLRQLFYRLVSDGTLRNTQADYSQLSHRSAQARRDGWFPRLMDRGRTIHRKLSFEGPDEAREWLRDRYRRDRTDGQEFSVYIAVEKAGLVELMKSWFWDRGLPILALGGYASQSYVDDIADDVDDDGRDPVLLYAGDFDPSGLDIERDFLSRSAWHEVKRVALTWPQVVEYDLPPMVGKASDTRAAKFVATHGDLVQVELDALPPEVLRALFEDALSPYLDASITEAVIAEETEERGTL
jgi:hypothetical protein